MKLIMESWRGFIKEDQDEAEEVEELEPATADEDPEEDAVYPPWVQDEMKIVSAEDERIKWWTTFDRLDTGEGEWKNKVIPSTPDDNPNLSEPGDERWSLRSPDALRSYPVITYPGEEAPGWIQRYLDRLLWVAPLGVKVDSDGRLNMLGSDYYARQFHYGASEWAGRGITTAAAIAEWQHKQKLKKVNKLRKIIELGGGLKELVARAEKVRRDHDVRDGPAHSDEHFSDALHQTKTFVMDKLLGDDE